MCGKRQSKGCLLFISQAGNGDIFSEPVTNSQTDGPGLPGVALVV